MTELEGLLRYTRATAIVGDILKIRAHDVGLGDVALVEMPDGEQSLAQAIQLEGDEVSLQVFGGGEGLSTQATVRFLGHPTQVTYSKNILGRVFRGDEEPMDGGPNLSGDRQVDSGGPSVNPVTRVVATRMIRTKVPMIDVFNCLVESQKIPIFSVAGEPYNQLLARIAIQADADIIVFGGLGLIFDDYYFFRSRFEDKLIKFADTFMTRFMNLNVSIPLEEALDLGWHTLAECFEPQELLMKQALIDKYYPTKTLLPRLTHRPRRTPELGHGNPLIKQELASAATRPASTIRAFPAVTRSETAAAYGRVQEMFASTSASRARSEQGKPVVDRIAAHSRQRNDETVRPGTHRPR
jgi:vacuolar-type H+-ATPase subunit B/Vma2